MILEVGKAYKRKDMDRWLFVADEVKVSLVDFKVVVMETIEKSDIPPGESNKGKPVYFFSLGINHPETQNDFWEEIPKEEWDQLSKELDDHAKDIGIPSFKESYTKPIQ